MNVNSLFERLSLPRKSRLPAFTGATGWLNSEPLSPDDLQGKVVLVDFWTYTCINWIRTLPYLRAWAASYSSHGLVVVGVHTPEFRVEHDLDNVRRNARDLGVGYPIVTDNHYAIWEAFSNHAWPALYLADAEGRIRYNHFGEGAYERSERAVQQLLVEAGAVDLPQGPAPVEVRGIEAAAAWDDVGSPETYVGVDRSQGFASPEDLGFDEPRVYTVPPQLRTNEWALAGNWTLRGEDAVLNEPSGRIAFRFHARDLNLILAPGRDGVPVRFRVRLDGLEPGAARGLDVDDEGAGVVEQSRLYQLIRQPRPIRDRQFEVEFLDPGATATCFTFG